MRATTVFGVLLVLLGAVCTAAELTGPALDSWVVPACLALGSLAGAALVARLTAGLPGRSGRPWRALAAAGVLLASGQLIAGVRGVTADRSTGGVEDLAMLAAAPVAIAGALWLMPSRAGRRIGSRALLDGVILTASVAVLGHVALGDLLPEGGGAEEEVLATAYPLVAVALCGIGLVPVTAVVEARRRAATWLLVTFLGMAVAAVSGAVGRATGSPWPLLLADLAWLGTLAAAARGAAADPGEPAGPPAHRTLPLRGGLAALAAAGLLLAVLTGGAVVGRPLRPAEAAAGLLVVGLMSGRTLLWALDAHRLTRRLQRAERRFRALVHSGDAVTVVLDPVGRVSWASGPVAEQLGWADDDLSGRALAALLHVQHRAVLAQVTAAVRAGAPVELPVTVRLGGRSGVWHDIEVLGAALDGVEGGLVLHLRDVTERSATQRELERMAYTDFLTGLPNRARLMAALDVAVGRAAAGRRACLLLLDLDGFKSVNDVSGHDSGDLLLQEVAEVLSGAARDGDLVARLGGDEFALVVDSGPEEAVLLAERLVALLDRTHRFPTGRGGDGGGPPLHVSASIGVAEVGPHGDASATMREADLALRTAKADGKNAVRSCGQSIVEETGRRSRLARDLVLALERQELRVDYQPVVGLEGRRILGLEALVRWDHPELGAVSPEEFVGLAEEEGLIVPLQRWVLRTATAEHARLVAGGRDLRMAVNVSVLHVQARCLVEDVADALERAGLPADRLMIELTESVFADDAELLRSTLSDLSDLGCVVALDDFGRGASSLTQLAGLPVDVLKMDRGFVTGIESDGRRAALVAAVVDLGRTLGMDVVAEGVETPAQLAALTALGCDFVQGWLLGRPVAGTLVAGVVDGFDPTVLDGAAPDGGTAGADVSHDTLDTVHLAGRLG
ncbi:putative bifunctional diguanylate cyclase/phosphodiesterase [Trujillonella endophytica]|uniref:putative bifunctional diguanylate cyclase/phosphodiesterase n=1 Tax=Trujillonella endophytica TaxID=673521 RepID=UPI001113DB6C|nr:EAL domain-containing protein [Trujillella endophytica]